MSANPLHVNATELLREPGLRRHISVVIASGDLDVVLETIAGDVSADLDLVSTIDDLALSGSIDVAWRGACRRCLKEFGATIVIEIDERYAERPSEHDDAFAIEHGQIDLTPALRDNVLLAVDELRLCRDDCAGLCPTCGADLNAGRCACVTDVVDERWAMLDELR
jgi:uncharacterized protein